MSIKYEAKYGKGFIVTAKEISQLPEEKIDELYDNHYFHTIDAYRWGDNIPYFYGIVASNLNCEYGEYYQMSSADEEFSPEEMSHMIHRFKYFFPNRSSTPHHYMLACII